MRFLPSLSFFIFSLILASCATAPRQPEIESPVAAVSETGPAESRESAPVQEEKPDPEAERRALLASYPALPEAREFILRIFPEDSVIHVLNEGELLPLESRKIEKDRHFFTSDAMAVLVQAEGYTPLVLPLPREPGMTEAKLERPWKVLEKRGETDTEWQPKSVRFAPDGKSVFVANLGERTAISQFAVNPPALLRHFQVPEEYREARGFVETAILPGRNEVWLSQMTTNTIHIFNLTTGDHQAAISISGTWPKVLLASEDESRVYASCWESSTVVEIDTATRKEIRSLDTGAVPRGLAFAADGKELLVALFASAGIDRIDLTTGKRTALHDAAPGREYAMRHIVHDPERGEYYITAMGVGRVYRLSESGEWMGYWQVGDKPNTCRISPSGNRLFVSCRGPNNPDTGYLTRGYEYGKVFVINLESGELEGWIWGRDQTTGLDISPDGRLLAFTDFLSANLEIYAVR